MSFPAECCTDKSKAGSICSISWLLLFCFIWLLSMSFTLPWFPINIHDIPLWGPSNVYILVPYRVVRRPSLERASLWRNDVAPPTSPVGLENSATMATTARRWTGTQWTCLRLGIWRIFLCSRCFCCSPIALASGDSLAPGFLSLLSAVSLPVVVVPRCILTEASALGSALHLITTITVAASFASSVS